MEFLNDELAWLSEPELVRRGEKSAVLSRVLALGFDEPAASLKNLQSIRRNLPVDADMARVLQVVRASAGPDLAAAGFASLLSALTPETRTWLVGLSDPDLRSLAELFSISASLSELVVRRATEIRELIGPAGLDAQNTVPISLPDACLSLPGDKQAAAVARFKRTTLLRIAASDLGRRVSIETVFRLLSEAADETVRQALFAAARLAGTSERGLVVLAMGKLGGRELNYSSDVDLVFLRDEAAGTGENVRRLAEALVAVLEADTPWGRPLRVDLRLRPEGSTGTLVPTVRSAQQYYETRASAWEYQALTRARPIAGEMSAGENFLSWAAPLVYPENLSGETLSEMVMMRRRHEGVQSHVKQRRGGIRDIEFTVQWLCQAEGRLHPETRRVSTLEGIRALNRLGALKDRDAGVLNEAYRFLRALEHRLQLAQELQTFTLPADPGDRKMLARSLGLADAAALEAAFSRHTEGVTEVVDRVLAERGACPRKKGDSDRFPNGGRSEQGKWPLSPFLGRELARLSGKFHFDPGPVAEYLSLPVPREKYLERLKTVLETPAFPSGLLEQRGSDGRPPDVAGLLRLAGYSTFFYEKMLADPALAEGVLDGPDTPVAVHAFINRSLGQAAASDLSRLRLRALGAVAALDMSGQYAENIPALIAAVNETVILRLLAAKGIADELEVYALGRLGGREGAYSSDADLLFIARDTATASALAGRVQEVLRFLNREVGLETDERLRPEGEKGVLIPTRDGFASYVASGMQAWEFLALWGRLRALTTPAVEREEEVLGLLMEHMPPRGKLLEETRRMRQLQKEAAKPADVKRGEGGLADVEMLLYTLAASGRLREPHTLLVTNELAAMGALPLADAAAVSAAYRFLARLERFLRLARPDVPAILPRVEERQTVALALGYRDGVRKSAARLLSEDVDYHRGAAAELFTRALQL